MNLTLTPGVLQCTPDDKRSDQVVGPLNCSLMNDGDIIYNGSAEPFRVPVLSKCRRIFTNYSEDAPLEGWDNARQLTMIDLDRVGIEQREPLLRRHLDQKTVDVWCGTFFDVRDYPQFKTNAAAIRVDNADGNWFEMIINKAK